MTLLEWGAVGELIGGIAIIVSLMYVGLQVRDSNREARAATIQAALDSELFTNAKIVDYAGTWDKVVTGAPLAEGKQTRRAIGLFNLLMTATENQYHQYIAGYLDAQSWEGGTPHIIVVQNWFEELKRLVPTE